MTKGAAGFSFYSGKLARSTYCKVPSGAIEDVTRAGDNTLRPSQSHVTSNMTLTQSEGADNGESEYIVDMAARVWKKMNFRATGKNRFACLFVHDHWTFEVNVLPLQPVASGSSPSKLEQLQQSVERHKKKQK
ncbi:hypothetical protein JVT61DRAFT_14223 [Boletus reticuloceps]|uniref:Uncharacterized protein n=1 Tax=Boletus reticuloceps TaxID=495285 RepID=A0A8I2YCX1_9AGAM|nr:hypothetical protein JVT61DRAFT_14223 [Boletus reticuloceps]